MTVRQFQPIITVLTYLFMAYYIAMYAVEIAHGGNSWKTADWLINYAGGAIRRGLIGALLYRLHDMGISLLWSAFFLQAAIYLAIAHYVLRLFFLTERNVAWLMFIFSPAFIFLFPFYDTNGGFRKEIIVFLAFCLLVMGFMRKSMEHRYLVASLVTYAIAIFSHELSVFCLVFFVYVVYRESIAAGENVFWGKLYITGYVIIGACGLIFALLHSGGKAQAALICQSLERAGLSSIICSGAIHFLGVGIGDQMHHLVWVHLATYMKLYPLLFALSMLPVFLTDWWKTRMDILIMGFISILPLFVVAVDWGRWIHIYMFMIFLLILFESCKRAIAIRPLPVIFAMLYATLWSLPHVGTYYSKGMAGWLYNLLY